MAWLRAFSAAALLLACGIGAAHALGLGEIALRSRLGEPLRAEVPLLAAEPGQINAACFSLATPAHAADDIPWLERARLTLGGGPQAMLRLSTAEPVPHPILMLGIRVACGADVTREYTLLLEPAIVDTPRAARNPPAPRAPERQPRSEAAADEKVWAMAEGETLGSIAAHLYPRNRRAQQRFVSAVARANPDLFDDPHQAASAPLAEGTRVSIPEIRQPAPPVLDEPAAPRPAKRAPRAPDMPLAPPAAPPQQDRLTIGGDPELAGESGLRLSQSLDLRRSRVVSETQRELLRQERRLLAALEDQIVLQLSLAEKIRRMEEALASMKGGLAQVEQEMQPAPVTDPATGLKSAPAVSTPTAPPVAAPPAPPLPPPAPATAVTEPAAPKAVPTVPNAAPTAEAPAAWRDWVLLGLLAAGVTATLLWLRVRSRRVVQVPQEEELVEDAESPATRPLLTQVDFPIEAEAPMPRPRQLPQRQPATSTLPTPELADEHSIDVAEHESAMELAEIMLSFGRVQGAAQTLADYIEANPRHSVEPWLKLLEIYHGAGMRAEFETLARHLNQTFNIELLTWEGRSENHFPEDIEAYTHIMGQIQGTWGKPECLAYMQDLMRDNRNGTRAGFPLPVLYDMLMLIGVLEECLGPQPLRPAPR